jgi:transposase
VFKKPIIVPIDNAPIHTSDEFINGIERWQAMGLFLYFLPPYSPQLNKIEITKEKNQIRMVAFRSISKFSQIKKSYR